MPNDLTRENFSTNYSIATTENLLQYLLFNHTVQSIVSPVPQVTLGKKNIAKQSKQFVTIKDKNGNKHQTINENFSALAYSEKIMNNKMKKTHREQKVLKKLKQKIESKQFLNTNAQSLLSTQVEPKSSQHPFPSINLQEDVKTAILNCNNGKLVQPEPSNPNVNITEESPNQFVYAALDSEELENEIKRTALLLDCKPEPNIICTLTDSYGSLAQLYSTKGEVKISVPKVDFGKLFINTLTEKAIPVESNYLDAISSKINDDRIIVFSNYTAQFKEATDYNVPVMFYDKWNCTSTTTNITASVAAAELAYAEWDRPTTRDASAAFGIRFNFTNYKDLDQAIVSIKNKDLFQRNIQIETPESVQYIIQKNQLRLFGNAAQLEAKFHFPGSSCIGETHFDLDYSLLGYNGHSTQKLYVPNSLKHFVRCLEGCQKPCSGHCDVAFVTQAVINTPIQFPTLKIEGCLPDSVRFQIIPNDEMTQSKINVTSDSNACLNEISIVTNRNQCGNSGGQLQLLCADNNKSFFNATFQARHYENIHFTQKNPINLPPLVTNYFFQDYQNIELSDQPLSCRSEKEQYLLAVPDGNTIFEETYSQIQYENNQLKSLQEIFKNAFIKYSCNSHTYPEIIYSASFLDSWTPIQIFQLKVNESESVKPTITIEDSRYINGSWEYDIKVYPDGAQLKLSDEKGIIAPFVEKGVGYYHIKTDSPPGKSSIVAYSCNDLNESKMLGDEKQPLNKTTIALASTAGILALGVCGFFAVRKCKQNQKTKNQDLQLDTRKRLLSTT